MANVYFNRECITVDDAAMPEFCNRFRKINAGGGLVRNSKGEYLVIFRRDIWDLPKGKQEPGETIEQCALREVSEETGLKELHLSTHICDTFHTYKLLGESCIKRTSWYTMECSGAEEPVPQTEEEITKVEWVSKERLQTIAEATFPSIKEVFSHAGLL